jgi:hypothetical protein
MNPDLKGKKHPSIPGTKNKIFSMDIGGMITQDRI